MLNESSQIDDVSVAECFIKKHKNFLKLYTIYCQNYKQTHDAIEQMEREHHLDKSIERVRLKYGHALKMGTYLQLPVLRITKYHLLLSRYLKLISNTDTDTDKEVRQKMGKALTLMQQVNDQINREMPDLNCSETTDTDDMMTMMSENMSLLIEQYGDILKQVI